MSAGPDLSRRRLVTKSAGVAILALTPGVILHSPAGATAGDMYVVARSAIRLRSGPGIGYAILATLAMGTVVEYLAAGGSADGYEWAKVRVASSGKTGFVAFPYLAP